MSYDPTVWKSGDTITSAKLNKLEQGVADAQGGGGGGGGATVLDITTVPYLAQAMQTSFETVVGVGLATYANTPFFYSATSTDANVVADMETLVSFIDTNKGSAILALANGMYVPVSYEANGIFFKLHGWYTTPASFAFLCDVEMYKASASSTSLNFYCTVTTNIVTA